MFPNIHGLVTDYYLIVEFDSITQCTQTFQLSRISKEAPEELSRHEHLVLAIVEQLSSDTLDVGPAAASVITNIGEPFSALF